MNQRQHTRSSSHGRSRAQPSQPRLSKPPALHRRGQSYNHAQSNSSGKPGLGGSKKTYTEVLNPEDEEETGMASFLQFCTTCEKQIVTPGSSILYCSEACRKKDFFKQTPIEGVHSPSLMSGATSYFDVPPADIIPQRSPTVLRPVSLTFSDLTLSDNESSTEDNHEDFDPCDSEAGRYLAQFHSQSYTTGSRSSRRPRINRTSTATESGLPSLVNTPSSSVGTAASMASCRPLRPRHDPLTGHFPRKSADLVIPTYPTTAPSSPTQLMKDSSLKSSAGTITSLNTVDAGEVSFKKMLPTPRDRNQTDESLKHLFSHEAMQSRPKNA